MKTVGMRIAPHAIADYMKKLFGLRAEPWLVDDEPTMTTTIDFDGSSSGLVQPPAVAVREHALPSTLRPSASAPIVVARTELAGPPPPEQLGDDTTTGVAWMNEPTPIRKGGRRRFAAIGLGTFAAAALGTFIVVTASGSNEPPQQQEVAAAKVEMTAAPAPPPPPTDEAPLDDVSSLRPEVASPAKADATKADAKIAKPDGATTIARPDAPTAKPDAAKAQAKIAKPDAKPDASKAKPDAAKPDATKAKPEPPPKTERVAKAKDELKPTVAKKPAKKPEKKPTAKQPAGQWDPNALFAPK
jgi:hypothetical protein